MSIERLKKLAGIETKTVVQEAPKEITLNLGNYRFSDLMEVRMAACVRGGKVTVNESGNRFDVSVTFANTETVTESINDFKKAIGLVVEGEKVPQIDHAEYQEKLKNKTDDQLEYIIKDAQAAIKANPDAPKSQGYYQDEINYARMELNKRKKKPVKEGSDTESLEVVEEGENEGKSKPMYGLYVQLPGKDHYGIEFSADTSAECKQQWRDEKDSYGKGAKYKIVKLTDNPPTTIKEASESNFFQSVDDEKNEIEDRMGTEKEIEQKIEVPAEVMKSVTDRILELNASHEKYDDKGYNDDSTKVKAIKSLEKIKDYLENYTVENAKHCVIFYNTLMSPITNLFPAIAVNFILKGRHAIGLDLNNDFKLKPVDTNK